MDLLSKINKQDRGGRKKKLEIRYVAVKNRDIVQNMSIDNLKAEIMSVKMTKYLNKISTGQIKKSHLKGIAHQFFFYCSNLIFWIVMGCGIADFGRRGL